MLTTLASPGADRCATRAATPGAMSGLAAMRVGVVIATKGRPELAALVVQELTRQTATPDAIVIAVSDLADAPGVSGGNIMIAESRPGSCAQRNAGLELLADTVDIVVFFDDDFVPSRYWLENLCALFASRTDVVAVTGQVLADGIKTAGLGWAKAAGLVERADRAARRSSGVVRDGVLPYGCNMAFRRAAIGELRFDERLVLYGWQDDTDFGARIAARGRCVHSDALWGVHLGVKRGRSPGRQLGYSQMVNPRYLVAKGTMPPRRALNLAGRNLAANALRALYPEPYIDRRGRLRGNLIGLWDIATGRWRPERAAELAGCSAPVHHRQTTALTGEKVAINPRRRAISDEPIADYAIRLVKIMMPPQRRTSLLEQFVRHAPAWIQRAGEKAFDLPIPQFIRSNTLLFIHVPKNAGTTVATQIYGSQVAHRPASFYYQSDTKWFLSRERFGIVRNPWDRLVSGYEFMRRTAKGLVDADPRVKRIVQHCQTFEEFVTTHLVCNPLVQQDPSFLPQEYFLFDEFGNCLVENIFRFEELSCLEQWLRARGIAFSMSKRYNQSTGRNNYKSYYSSAELIEIVGQYYANDVKHFNYRF